MLLFHTLLSILAETELLHFLRRLASKRTYLISGGSYSKHLLVTRGTRAVVVIAVVGTFPFMRVSMEFI